MAGAPLKKNQIQKVSAKNDQPPACQFEGLTLPDQFAIFAAGAYAGRTIDHQIDQSGHMATQIDVVVNHIEKPVVLMLGAYEPTVWNIGWTSDTRIIAVMVSGYHRQVIAGLDDGVPTLISTFDNGGACGYSHVEEGRLGWLNPLAKRLFKRPVDMVYLAKEGMVTIGADVLIGAKVTTSPLTPPESYFDKTHSLAGLPGLEDAARKGILRDIRGRTTIYKKYIGR